MYVVDCSVAVKWFLPEPLSAAAARVRESHRALHIPELFMLEFGSAVLKRIRRREIALNEGFRMIKEVGLLPMYRHSDALLFPLAFEIASTTNASIYDSMYLALAVQFSGLMITADRRFVSHVADTEFAKYVLWIEDLPAT